MFTLIAILAPSFLGVKFIEHLLKGLTIRNTIYYYTILLLFSSLLNNLFCNLLWKLNDSILLNLNAYPIFFCKYVILSIIINIILGLVFVVIIKNISFKIVVEENVKNIKKAKNNNK